MSRIVDMDGLRVIVERTGFKPCDHIPEWSARCYLGDTIEDLRFAYGDSEESAVEALGEVLEEGIVIQ